jgi:hypothetical protein
MGRAITLSTGARKLALLLGVVTSNCLSQSVSNDVDRVEAVAAQAMLKRIGVVPFRLSINPALARPRTAPGESTSDTRPVARQRTLTQLVGAVEWSTVNNDCAQCTALKPAVVLHLSDPIVRSDSASISVTARIRPTSHGVREDYETVEFELQRRDGIWIVVRALQLGTS